MKLEDIKKIDIQCSLYVNYYDFVSPPFTLRPLTSKVHCIGIVMHDGRRIDILDALVMPLWDDVYKLLLMVQEAVADYECKIYDNIGEENDLWMNFYYKQSIGTHDRYKQFYNFELPLDDFKDIEMEIKYFPFRIRQALEDKFNESFEYFYNKAKQLTKKENKIMKKEIDCTVALQPRVFTLSEDERASVVKTEDKISKMSLDEYNEMLERKRDFDVVFTAERKGKWNEIEYSLEACRYPREDGPMMTDKQIQRATRVMMKIKEILVKKDHEGKIIIPKVKHTYHLPFYSEGSEKSTDGIIATMFEKGTEIFSEAKDFKVRWK